jgi:hypothetical protein
MSRHRIWFFSLASLAGVFCFAFANLPIQFAAAKDWRKFSAKSKATMQAKRQLIEQELGKLKMHPWAGDYYYGDGLGVNVDLTLAPGSGFVFTWNGCLGLYDQNYGDVAESDRKIRLLFKLPNKREGFRGIAPEFLPVTWGDRYYLIPSDGVVKFANAINAGFEPRNSEWGQFLLRRGDVSKQVSGYPNLPPEYSEYLLKSPIKAEVSAVKESRDKGSDRISIVLLNVGASQGVRKGMEFYVYSPSGVFESATITVVNDTSSEAQVFQCCDDKDRPTISWKLSSSAGRESYNDMSR